MNQIIEFGVTVILISASGVMAPGPLFAANLSYGFHGGIKSGIKIAIGHTIVELPLIILLGIGVFSLKDFPEFRTALTITGATILFVFAAIQIKTTLQMKELKFLNIKHGAIISGITLSVLNPFFIIWWLSIGFKLISDAVIIWAFAGILVVFLFHIWMDFVWLGLVAFFSSKSLKFLSNRNYKFLMIGLSFALIYFGMLFVLDVI
ncbi:MAG: lysine exporter protein LysE/YggA [Nitrosarchaeum sp.]|nr:lysine exporter protein LysE/YggA [Nitrosarchaeum sp.]